ncbi:arylamine N-acetyltransferase [Actinomadura citrea]|uniref:arylamine N-acetyltransferase family protein n=1 Tax=Actinomadura citrea TaxID=46158 RepID=UPI002E2B7DC3|nr:arylamine N-acetyltransferase [Actinomadura citrea]
MPGQHTSGSAPVPEEPGGPRYVADYLERLGIGDPGEPSLSGLFALHRAHVERVPYEVLEIQLGRPTTADPRYAAGQVLKGRGGYCVQLNGAFSTLLTALGYDVTWHRAGVHAGRKLPPVGPAEPAPHLVLTVSVEGGAWMVDVGLGDGLHEPLPLRAGAYRQGPFTFHLGPSRFGAGGWRFEHDDGGAIAGLDFSMEPAGPADFAEWHPYLATDPESRLVRTVAVMRRDATSVDSLTGCMLRHVDDSGRTTRELGTFTEWYGALAEVFDLPLADVGPQERTALWTKVRGAHDAWLEARARRSAART